MDKWKKEVQESMLDSEEEALEELEKQYKEALSSIEEKLKLFQNDIDQLDEALVADPMNEVLLSMKQAKVYQKQFQESLKQQINSILDNMQSNNYTTIQEYLKGCYEDGYLGTMYDLAEQHTPVIAPINQASVTKAVLTDSQISEGLYTKLKVDTQALKKSIASEISRGIASSMSYAEISRNLANVSKAGLANAKRIVRTEGNRINNQASADFADEAVAHGADLVKQWDATLDGLTRPSHRAVDGEFRELNERFSNGLMQPGDKAGGAAEVCNCRCSLDHVPRWAMKSGFIKVDNFTGEMYEFNSPEDYQQFKEWYWSEDNVAYMNYAQKMQAKYGTKSTRVLLESMTDREYDKYHELEAKSPLWNSEGKEKIIADYKAKLNAEKATSSTAKHATTREEAIDLLKNEIGFNETGKGLKYIDDETLIAQANQLSDLNSRFGVIGENYGGGIIAENNRKFSACTRGNFRSADRQTLVYSYDDFAHGVDHAIEVVERDVKSGWAMPCKAENYLVYTTTHEYGHMLCNKLSSKMVDLEAFQKEYYKVTAALTPSAIKKGEKLLEKTSKECAEKLFKEIMAIAKEANPEFSLRANISSYGKSCYPEAFAEVFANSQLGEPNELGNAMNIWLSRKGY